MFFALQYENTKLKDKLAELTERVNNIDITSIEVSVDNTTGTPSAEASISEGTFIINFKGLKGENGTDSTSNMNAGIGKPSMLGRDNDIYLDIESGIFYEFSKNEWFDIGTVSVGEGSNVNMD